MSNLSGDRDAEIAAILASTPIGSPKKKEEPVPEKKVLTDEEVLEQILNPPPPEPEPIIEKRKPEPVPQVTAKEKYMAIKSAMREKEEQQNRENYEQMQLLKRQMEISEPIAPAEPVPQPENAPVISGATTEEQPPINEPETFTPAPQEMPLQDPEQGNPDFIENDPFFQNTENEHPQEVISFTEESVPENESIDDFREEPPVREYIPKKDRLPQSETSQQLPFEPIEEELSEDEDEIPQEPPQTIEFESEEENFPVEKEKSEVPVKDMQIADSQNFSNPSTSVKKTKKKKKKTFGQRFIELFPQRDDDAFEIIRKLVFLASAMIFIVCIGLIGKYFYDNYKNQQMNTSVSELYQPTATQSVEEATEPPTIVNDEGEVQELFYKLPTVDSLLAINPDVVGWIHIPDTPIDYAVLQHRDPQTSNNYYLDKNIYLQTEKAGSIFLDYREDFDVVEEGTTERIRPNSQNLVVYGHNMHDYSMFGSLKRYINEEDFYDKHPIIYLNSNYREYQYKVFGMIIVDIADTTETAFDYWNVLNFEDETKFYNYVNEIKKRTVRLTNVDVKYGDELLTLSTCNSTFSEGRLVVFARKIRNGEDPSEGCTSTANPNVKWPNSYYKWRKNTYDPNGAFEPYG